MTHMMRLLRPLCLALLALSAVSAAAQNAQEAPKLIILGFDGADADLTRQWMDEGKLPNLAKLRGEGHLRAAALDDPVPDPGVLVDLRDRP